MEIGEGSFSRVYILDNTVVKQYTNKNHAQYFLNEIKILEKIGTIPFRYDLDSMRIFLDTGYVSLDHLTTSSSGVDNISDTSKRDDKKSCIHETSMLSRNDIYSIVSQSISELLLIHNKDVVHADIKPSNILWSTEQHVLHYCDFNISCIGPSYKLSYSPGYRPPECRKKGSKVTQKSDVWALGISLMEIISGKKIVNMSKLLKIKKGSRLFPSSKITSRGYKSSPTLGTIRRYLKGYETFIPMISKMLLPIEYRPTTKELYLEFIKEEQQSQCIYERINPHLHGYHSR